MDVELAALFIAVAETGSLAAAARRQNISASFASRRVSQLERELNTRLLNRTTRSLSLTEAGRMFLQWAREAVDRKERLHEQIAALRSAPEGCVRVAIDAWIASSYLPDVLKQFSAAYPEITLSVVTCDYPPDMLDGACDLAVHAGLPPRDDLVGQRAYDYRRFLCAAPAYLERHGTPRTPADLDRHKCLVHGSPAERVWMLRSKTGDVTSVAAQPYVETNSWLLLRTMAIEGLGIAHLGGPLPGADIRSGLLVRVLPELDGIPAGGSRLGVWVIHADAHPPRRVQLLARFLARYLRATISPREAAPRLPPDTLLKRNTTRRRRPAR
ncbi:LysR family transcriptional regulator [Vineibacter terrae]|uniref:LysR family transcriptional regulator n=1 Tax=Vineibacter terrae TaxID=2586908 RepID=A0A5C8PRX0_9HYPH|nr:LysR family transcriptional regulator [Vineibacter terrae]TXL78142.1 LysR family transcriptional regulator [Vineibacter terrae]